jgi:hypothetical protein
MAPEIDSQVRFATEAIVEEKPIPPDHGRQGWDFQTGRLPPELREYYLRQLTQEEEKRILDDLKELQETGGLEFSDFVDELEELVNSLEPPQ